MGLALQDMGPIVPEDKTTTSGDQQVVAAPNPDRRPDALAKTKAAILENAAKERAAAQPTATGGEPGATAEIKIDPEALAQITKLSAENRKMADRLKALEGAEPKAKQYDDIMSKATSMEKIAALGIDVDGLVKEMLAAEDAAGTPESKQLGEVTKKLDAIAAELAEEKKARVEERTAVTAEERTAASGEVTEHLRGMVAAEPTRWPEAAKRRSTPGDAAKIAISVAAKLGRAVTDDEAKDIYEKALDQIEKSHRDDLLDNSGNSVTLPTPGAQPAPTREGPQPRPRPTIDGSISRGAPPAAPNGSRKNMSEKESRAIALENIRRMNRTGR